MNNLIIISIIFFVQTTVKANCNNDPANLINSANCDFTTDVTGWNLSTGDSVVHDITDDFLGNAPGAAIVDAADLGSGFVYAGALNQCIEITTDTTAKTTGFWVKGNTGGDAECIISVIFYEGDGTGNCNLANRGSCTTSQVISSASGWTNLTCNTPVLTGSVETVNFAMSCGNGFASAQVPAPGDFTVKFDNAYVVPLGNTPVELIEFSIE